jgi:phosphate transport system substrate-binding protein
MPARHAVLSVGSFLLALALWPGPGAGDEPIKVGGTGAAMRAMELAGAALDGVKVVVLPGLGSRGGKQAVAEGAIDLAVSADPLSAAEESGGLKARVLGRTAFVFVVSTQSPMSGLSLQEAMDLYRGKTLTWPDGGRVRPILRPQLDSDTTFLRKMSPAMDQAVTEAHARPGMRVAASDSEAADVIESVPGAMGTSTLVLIVAERRSLKALAINGVRPTAESVRNGSYPHVKTLYLISRAPRPTVQRFVDFLASAPGRAVLSGLGFAAP